MAAQLALLHAQRQRFFQQAGRGQGAQQLGVQQALGQLGRRGQKTHAPVGSQNLGKATHVNGLAQTVQRAQAGGVRRRNVAVGVVFHHVKAVLVRQLQHTVGMARTQALTGGVVQHAHTDKQLGWCAGGRGLAVTGHHVQVRPQWATRHRQYAHTQRVQPGKLHCPTGFFHHHGVARLQQRAADHVQRMRSAHGRDDLTRRSVDVHPAQARRQGLPQTHVALGLTVTQRCGVQHRRAHHLAHRRRHEVAGQPVGREHTHARLWLVTDVMKHTPDERGCVDGRGDGRLANHPTLPVQMTGLATDFHS
jgi:hypothetical protein